MSLHAAQAAGGRAANDSCTDTTPTRPQTAHPASLKSCSHPWLLSASMSFFRSSGNNNTPPPNPNPAYNRVPQDGSDYNVSPGMRSARRPPPPSSQYASPPNGYNDPSNGLFEKPVRKPPPARSGGRFVAIQNPMLLGRSQHLLVMVSWALPVTLWH